MHPTKGWFLCLFVVGFPYFKKAIASLGDTSGSWRLSIGTSFYIRIKSKRIKLITKCPFLVFMVNWSIVYFSQISIKWIGASSTYLLCSLYVISFCLKNYATGGRWRIRVFREHHLHLPSRRRTRFFGNLESFLKKIKSYLNWIRVLWSSSLIFTSKHKCYLFISKRSNCLLCY